MALNPKVGSIDPPITGEILAAIAEGRWSANALARESGVDAAIIKRFLSGERDIKLKTVERLAPALGLRMVRQARGRGRPAKLARGEAPGPIAVKDRPEGPEARIAVSTAPAPDLPRPPGDPS